MSDRYQRQSVLGAVGPGGQARLAEGRALIVGVGGLGAALAPYLAGAGVGRLTVIDHDRVSLDNLHRQVLFTEADVGAPKAATAAARLAALNAEIEIEAIDAAMTPARAAALAPAHDVVLDAADRFALTTALSDACRAAERPLVSASVLGTSGYVGVFCAGRPSHRAVFPEPPSAAGDCASLGVMGPAVAVMGGLMAQAALWLLLGRPSGLDGRLLRLDFATMRVGAFDFDAAPEPETAPPIVGFEDLAKGDRLIDVRAPAEIAAAPLAAGGAPAAEAMDAAAALARPAAPGERLVFACATGLRAMRAAAQARAAGRASAALLW